MVDAVNNEQSFQLAGPFPDWVPQHFKPLFKKVDDPMYSAKSYFPKTKDKKNDKKGKKSKSASKTQGPKKKTLSQQKINKIF